MSMSLKKTRKILCLIFAAVMVAGNVLCFGSVLIKGTLCSPDYLKLTFLTKRVEEQCKQNFNDRIQILSLESSIPVRVFETEIKLDDEMGADAVERLFNSLDTSLYTSARIELFEELCTEYLEGNNIKYNKQQVHNTAVKAAEIYADSYGIDNIESMKAFVKETQTKYSRYASIGILLVVISIIAFFSLFSKNKDAFMAMLMGYIATGITFMLTSITALITGIGQSPKIYPSFYADAAANSVRFVFVISLLLGLAIAVVAYLLADYIERTRNYD